MYEIGVARFETSIRYHLTRLGVYERKPGQIFCATIQKYHPEEKSYQKQLTDALIETEKEYQIKIQKVKQKLFVSRLINNDINEEELCFWIAQGFDLNASYAVFTPGSITTPLYYAICENRYDLVRMLLKLGANPKIRDAGERDVKQALCRKTYAQAYIMLSILCNYGYIPSEEHCKVISLAFHKRLREKCESDLFTLWRAKEIHLFDLAINEMCKDATEDELTGLARRIYWSNILSCKTSEMCSYLAKSTDPKIQMLCQKINSMRL